MADEATTTRVKTKATFAWSAVPIALKRKLLADIDPNGVVRRASAEQLDDWLAQRFGAVPKVDQFVGPKLGRPLLDHWLPDLSKDDLERILIPLRHHVHAEPDSQHKADILGFLQSRQLKAGYRGILRTVFTTHYTEQRPVQPSAGTLRRPALELMEGEGRPADHELFEHQLEAHDALNQHVILNRHAVSKGLLVLPTGAGKTITIVEWLVDHVLSQGIRVLWLAHQRELLTQAQSAFRTAIACRPVGTSYTTRLMVSGAGGITLLGADDTDVAFLSLPMLAKGLDKAKRQRLATFLQKRTVIVVDEAHHAGAQTYHEALTTCLSSKPLAMIGLTATPWPGGLISLQRFHELFSQTIYEAGAQELTERGVLAQPVVHTIETDELVALSDDERRANDALPDISDAVLSRLNTRRRNQIVVDAYTTHRDEFGPTLVFAANIAHADHLTGAFKRADVPVQVVHGQADTHRDEVIDWFKQQDRAVLVSVRMLTEGVDLPTARTVILARPTTSRILLRQMIGRALRGPRAGGELKAHIVNIRDEWQNFSDVLEPPEVIEVDPPDPGKGKRRSARAGDPFVLPHIVDDDDNVLPAPVGAEGGRILNEAERTLLAHPTIRITVAEIAGWYQLNDRKVTVFAHQREAYQALIDDADADWRGFALLHMFEDLPPPLPSPRMLRAVVEHTRSFGPPTFHEFNDRSAPVIVARELMSGSWTEAEVEEHVRRRWSHGAIRLQMSLLDFEAAVDDERRRLRRRLRGDSIGLEPEDRGEPRGIDQSTLPKLPRADRNLVAIRNQVAAWMDVNTPLIAGNLRPLPPIDWTNRPVQALWGYWTLWAHGKRKGQVQIRINQLLATKTSIVSDEMLGYLVYHELLHHVLSTRGHDVGFRNYEAKWPNAAKHDAAFDTLREQYTTDPKRYA